MKLPQGVSPNHNSRPAPIIDMLVLHYTGMKTAEEALDRLCDPTAEVSAHYLVDEDGSIVQLVPEERRAWHAGNSYWRGRRNLNDVSIGIEIVNPGHQWGYRAFPAPQMAAVAALCREIIARHPIPARNVVGHSDIAPDRKTDPGEKFDWRLLAEHGIGLWPASQPLTKANEIRAALTEIGYTPDAAFSAILAAFQRHWRPALINGEPDPETTSRILALCTALNS